MIKQILLLFEILSILLEYSSPEILTDQLGADSVSVENIASEIDQFRQLLQPFLQERVPGTEGNLQVQKYISRELDDLGWHIYEDRFEEETPIGVTQFTNIVATLDPNAESRLTLACHFDSKKFDEFVFIGATDSAVPCSLMLYIAKQLNASLWDSVNNGAKTTLQLIFFDGEEAFVDWTAKDSLYGSRHLAKKMEEMQIVTDELNVIPAIRAISVLILLDLIGTSDCRFTNWFPQTSHLYVQLQDIEKRLFMAGLLDSVDGQISRNSDGNQYFQDKQLPRMMRSGIADDHVPFMRKNVSILHLISHPFPSVWHKSTDNEDALSFPSIINLTRILRIFVSSYLSLDLQP